MTAYHLNEGHPHEAATTGVAGAAAELAGRRVTERLGLPVRPYPACVRLSLHSSSGVPLLTSPRSSGRGERSAVVGGARERTAPWCLARNATS